jgi:hypothetical protein
VRFFLSETIFTEDVSLKKIPLGIAALGFACKCAAQPVIDANKNRAFELRGFCLLKMI